MCGFAKTQPAHTKLTNHTVNTSALPTTTLNARAELWFAEGFVNECLTSHAN